MPSGNQFITPETGNVFVTIMVQFRNNAKSSKSATPFDFKLAAGGVERDPAITSPCEAWSSVDVSPGATFGPKCLGFEVASGNRSGTLKWRPGLVSTYDIPVEGVATNGGSNTGAETTPGANNPPGPSPNGTAPPLPNHCSPGLSATQGIPCELASNMFYEYYRAVQNGRDTTALSVWSPAVKQYRTANCSRGAGMIICVISGTNLTNAKVQITQAALDAYTPQHARDYAEKHDLGPKG